MAKTPQQKYLDTQKGKDARIRAQNKYDTQNPEKRRAQKKEYMRRKRSQNPNYCKWK